MINKLLNNRKKCSYYYTNNYINKYFKNQNLYTVILILSILNNQSISNIFSYNQNDNDVKKTGSKSIKTLEQSKPYDNINVTNNPTNLNTYTDRLDTITDSPSHLRNFYSNYKEFKKTVNSRYMVYGVHTSPGNSILGRLGHSAVVIDDFQYDARYMYDTGYGLDHGIWYVITKGLMDYVNKTLYIEHDKPNSGLSWYVNNAKDRKVILYKLNFTNTQKMVFVSMMNNTIKNKYDYHPIHRNCTTLIRDIINKVTNNQLKHFVMNKANFSYIDKSINSLRRISNGNYNDDLILSLGTKYLFFPLLDHRLNSWEMIGFPHLLYKTLIQFKFKKNKDDIEESPLVTERTTIRDGITALYPQPRNFNTKINFIVLLISIILILVLYSPKRLTTRNINLYRVKNGIGLIIVGLIFGTMGSMSFIATTCALINKTHLSNYYNQVYMSVFDFILIIIGTLLIIDTIIPNNLTKISIKLLGIWCKFKYICALVYVIVSIYTSHIYSSDIRLLLTCLTLDISIISFYLKVVKFYSIKVIENKMITEKICE